jgi:hypothetical protein
VIDDGSLMPGRINREQAAFNRDVRDWASLHRIPCNERRAIPWLVILAYMQAQDASQHPQAAHWPLSLRELCGHSLAARDDARADERAPGGSACLSATDLVHIFNEKTSIQSAKILRPHYGKWLCITGILADVTEWHHTFSHVYFENMQGIDEARVMMQFDNKETDEERLEGLERGTPMAVMGQIGYVDGIGVHLEHCKIESVGPIPVVKPRWKLQLVKTR